MKNISLYILFLICMFCATTAMAKQKEYKGKMRVTPLQLEQIGDSLHISIDFNISGVNVDSRRSISLIPMLIGNNVEKTLPEVMVKGCANYLTSKRELALMSLWHLPTMHEAFLIQMFDDTMAKNNTKTGYVPLFLKSINYPHYYWTAGDYNNSSARALSSDAKGDGIDDKNTLIRISSYTSKGSESYYYTSARCIRDLP